MICFNSMRGLFSASIIVLSLLLLSISVNARPLLIISEHSSRCVSVHALKGSALAVKYNSLDNNSTNRRRPDGLYYIDVFHSEEEGNYDDRRRRRMLKHYDILENDGSFTLDMDDTSDVDICVFSSIHRGIRLDISFAYGALGGKDEIRDKDEKLNRQMRDLRSLQNQVLNMKLTLGIMMEYSREIEEEESVIYYKYDDTYKKLTWAPSIRLFVLLGVGVAQAKYILLYLRKQHYI